MRAIAMLDRSVILSGQIMRVKQQRSNGCTIDRKLQRTFLGDGVSVPRVDMVKFSRGEEGVPQHAAVTPHRKRARRGCYMLCSPCSLDGLDSASIDRV